MCLMGILEFLVNNSGVFRKNNFIEEKLKELNKLEKAYWKLSNYEIITEQKINSHKKKNLKDKMDAITAEMQAPKDFYSKFVDREYYPMRVAWFRFFIYLKKTDENKAIEWAKLAIDLNIEVRSGKSYEERIKLLTNKKSK
jgi:hypothetical protein